MIDAMHLDTLTHTTGLTDTQKRAQTVLDTVLGPHTQTKNGNQKIKRLREKILTDKQKVTGFGKGLEKKEKNVLWEWERRLCSVPLCPSWSPTEISSWWL